MFLVVRLDPILFDTGVVSSPNPENNNSWKNTVVFNNVYGWHYSNLQSLGIWQPVSIRGAPDVAMPHPFVRTVDAEAGILDLALRFEGGEEAWSGTLRGSIAPDNFSGESHSFERRIESDDKTHDTVLRLEIPEPQPGGQSIWATQISIA